MNELPALVEAFSSLPNLVVQPKEYRLYYDEAGNPITMSMENFPESGKYIIIDRETYDKADYSKLRVKNGQLEKIETSTKHYFSLSPGGNRFATVKGHANILVKNDYDGEIVYYDFKNN